MFFVFVFIFSSSLRCMCHNSSQLPVEGLEMEAIVT
jgi:hypothetical protein